MRRFTFDRTFYIPQHSSKVSDKQSDAVAYIYTTARGRFGAAVFFGKQAKPVANYTYRTAEERAKRVAEMFAGRKASVTATKERRVKRTAENKLEVGDILNTCWGYDQTNREFFEVIEVAGKFVVIREIAQASKDTGHDQGICVPQAGTYIGQPLRKLVQWGTSVTIDEVRTASKWNTKTVAGVPVGPALSWSSGH